MAVTAKTGTVVGAEIVSKHDRLVVMTTKGKALRLRVGEIRTVGRIAQGVKLMHLAPDDRVANIARLVQESDTGNN